MRDPSKRHIPNGDDCDPDSEKCAPYLSRGPQWITGMVFGAWGHAHSELGMHDVELWRIQDAYDRMSPKPKTPCSREDWVRLIELSGHPTPRQLDLFGSI